MTTIARWAVWIPLFLIPFLALYIASDLYFPFITGKNFLFRIFVEIMLAGWAVLAIADRRYRPQFSWVLASFALLVGWMVVADALAVNPHKAFWSNFERMDGFVTLAHVFAFFLVIGPVLTVDRLWRRWWLTFVSATALVCTYGFFQLIGAAQTHQGATRLDASLGNAEYLAGYLLLTLGITVWQAVETRGKDAAWLRYSLFALAALEVVILVGTLTRGTVIGLIGAVGFGALAWLVMGSGNEEGKRAGNRGRKYAAGALVAVLVLVGGFFALRNTAFVTESPNLQRFASIFSLREALGTRLTIWEMALQGAQERPLHGWGHEGYNYIFNEYFQPSLHGQEPWFDRAHNIYLDWLVAGGVPALLLFLALALAAVWMTIRAPGLSRTERIIILSTLVGYGIQGLAVFDNLFTYVPLAALLAYLHTRGSRPIAALERAGEPSKDTATMLVAPVALVLALVLIYMVNIPTYAAGKELIKGITPSGSVETRLGYFKSALERDPFATQEIREQLLQFAQGAARSEQVDAGMKQEIVAFAEAQFQEEIARAPRDARLHIQYAVFLRSLGRYDEARAASAQARELSPLKQTVILEQGAEAWEADDFAAARTLFDEAYALATSSDELAMYAAAGRVLTGDIPAAKELLAGHFGTTTINSMPLALAYQEVGAWNDLIAVMRVRAEQAGDAENGYQLALAYAQAGRINEARTQVRAVMAAFPETAAHGTALLTQLGGM